MDRDSFPLEVIPGSHRRGLITTVTETRNGWEIQPEHMDLADFVPIEVAAGDAVFLSGFTIHRTGLTGSRLRVALSTRFDNAAEPSYIERAYPTAYVRTVHREQYRPGFPRDEDLERIWRQ